MKKNPLKNYLYTSADGVNVTYFELKLSGSLWLRQPPMNLRSDLGISFYVIRFCSQLIQTIWYSLFVTQTCVALCVAVSVC